MPLTKRKTWRLKGAIGHGGQSYNAAKNSIFPDGSAKV